MKVLSRRALLRGSGGIAVALPLLDAMLSPRRARAAGAMPKRFIVFFSGNGTIMQAWAPGGTDTAFTFSPILAPLQNHRNQLLIMRGLNNEVGYTTAGGNPHDMGMGTMLTGIGMKIGPSGLGRAGHIIDGSAGGPSIDQVIATNIGKASRFTSLSLGVQSTSTILEPMVTRMAYRGSFDPVIPQDDPGKVFASLFSNTMASQAEVLNVQKRRGTVLDAVMTDYTSLMSKLGTDDRAKLDRHVTSIRELEKQLLMPGIGAGCGGITPMAPTVSLTPVACLQDARPAMCVGDFASIGKAQMDLMVLALACDLTRVATLQWSTAESTVVHTEIGVTKEHHLMSHDDVTNVDALTKINTWYAQQLNYLLDQLTATKGPDGATLLDGSLVFWVNEMSRGTDHSRRDLAYVLAGGGGALRTGRYVTFKGDPHNKLYTTFLNMFGIPATYFGDPSYTGTLTGLS
ncbi:MAG TPA: DUF1552 domain-containing protein [Polyangiaceae bacterium]|jgi:hypothetical protein|nr:DUF1552 domain-containing protein [Polyangiaceae bacterium]